MAITVYSAKKYTKSLKVTIQASGKLGFTEETARSLALSQDKYIKIAFDNEANQFCMAVLGIQDEDAFRVRTAGQYFYLSTTALFKQLGIEYKKYNIMFDLVRDESLDEFLGGSSYRMDERKVDRKKGGNR